MKLGFLFDTKFIEYNGEYYSINLTQNFWNSRYLRYFDEVVVIGSFVPTNEDPSEKFVKSSSDKVHFCCIEDSSVVHRILTQKQQSDFIREHIADCDRVICRGWWGTAVCKELGIPYMIEVVSCVWDSYWNHSFMGKVVALPNFILQKRAVKQAPYVLYVTQSFLQKRYPTANASVGISDVELKESSNEDAVALLERRINRIKEHRDTVKIGTAAAISVRYKGQQYMIKALAELKKRGITNIEYQLAGKGDKSYLLSIAKKYGVEDQVKFLGPVPHEEMFDWYDSLDLCIQPSLTEGLPRAVVEAMSRALPCIGSNAGGIPELIDVKYLFDKKRPIANQIVDIYRKLNEFELIEMATRNIEVSKRFKSEELDEKRQAFLAQFCGLDAKEEIWV